jgi:hypothetical protein
MKLPAVSLLSQTNPGQPNLTILLLQEHFNIILPTTPMFCKWSSSFGFPTKTLCAVLAFPIRATRPANLITLHLIILTFGVK